MFSIIVGIIIIVSIAYTIYDGTNAKNFFNKEK